MNNKIKGMMEILDNIRFDHVIWLAECRYNLQEIELYENRLLQLIEIFIDKKEQEELEIILRDFGFQRRTLHHIRETIKLHETNIQKKTKSNGEFKMLSNSNHIKVKNVIISFRSSYNDLKKRFHELADSLY